MNKRVIEISTILGISCCVLSIAMCALPMFIELKKDFTDNWGVPLTFGLVGLGLIGIPDELFGSLGKLFKRKSDEL
jgi:hypothetical protein